MTAYFVTNWEALESGQRAAKAALEELDIRHAQNPYESGTTEAGDWLEGFMSTFVLNAIDRLVKQEGG